MKIKNIIEGWYKRLFKPLNEHEKHRLLICEQCDNKIKLYKCEYVCKACGCPIKSKIRSKSEVCALNK
jgi:hypothetical protein